MNVIKKEHQDLLGHQADVLFIFECLLRCEGETIFHADTVVRNTGNNVDAIVRQVSRSRAKHPGLQIRATKSIANSPREHYEPRGKPKAGPKRYKDKSNNGDDETEASDAHSAKRHARENEVNGSGKDKTEGHDE